MKNKKLCRSSRDKKIFGVCSGIGEYLDIDPVFFRIIFLAAFFMGSLGLWAYMIFALAMPKNESYSTSYENYTEPKRLLKSKNKIFFGVCGGIAEYFNFDIAIVRIIIGLSALFGVGIVLYIICALVMPSQP